MSAPTRSLAPRRLATLAAWSALAGFALLLALHLRAILADSPMEMRDGAALVTAVALLDGRNPYALPGLGTAAIAAPARRRPHALKSVALRTKPVIVAPP